MGNGHNANFKFKSKTQITTMVCGGSQKCKGKKEQLG